MSNCNSFREQISAYIDGELNNADRDALEKHLDICQECRKIYDTFSAVSREISDSDNMDEAPSGLASGTMYKIRTDAGRGKLPGIMRHFSAFGRYTGLAAVLAILILGYNAYRSHSQNSSASGISLSQCDSPATSAEESAADEVPAVYSGETASKSAPPSSSEAGTNADTDNTNGDTPAAGGGGGNSQAYLSENFLTAPMPKSSSASMSENSLAKDSGSNTDNSTADENTKSTGSADAAGGTDDTGSTDGTENVESTKIPDNNSDSSDQATFGSSFMAIGNSVETADDIYAEYGYTERFYSISYLSGDIPDDVSSCELLKDTGSEQHYKVPVETMQKLEDSGTFDKIIYDDSSAEYGLVIMTK